MYYLYREVPFHGACTVLMGLVATRTSDQFHAGWLIFALQERQGISLTRVPVDQRNP